jgi:DNA-binding transcriptional LysR family regulator
MAPAPWLGVEPRHLATFAAVADAGSFRGAAADLGYAQSAVSQQIAQLERALGTRLIKRGRGNRDLVLTPAGSTLLPHARRIVELVRAASADITHMAGGGPVRLAVEPAATTLLPGLAQRLAAARPEARLSVAEVPSAQQAELVMSGAVDLAIGSFFELPARVCRRVIRTDAWVLVGPLSPSPAAADTLSSSLTALGGMPLIEDRSHPIPGGIGQLGGDRVIACDRLAVAVELVRAGSGCAILPQLALGPNENDLSVVELDGLLPPRTLSVIWLRARRLPRTLAALGVTDGDASEQGSGMVAVA